MPHQRLQRVGRVVRAFKGAVSEEIVPESVWRALTTVRGLERGRTEARETEPGRRRSARGAYPTTQLQ